MVKRVNTNMFNMDSSLALARKLSYVENEIKECYSDAYFNGSNASNIPIQVTSYRLQVRVTPDKTTFAPGETFLVELTSYPQGVEFNFELTNSQCSFQKESNTSWRVSFGRPVSTSFKISGISCQTYTHPNTLQCDKITPIISLGYQNVPFMTKQRINISNTYGSYQVELINKSGTGELPIHGYGSLNDLTSFELMPNGATSDYCIRVSGEWVTTTDSQNFSFFDSSSGMKIIYNDMFGYHSNIGMVKSKFFFNGIEKDYSFILKYTPYKEMGDITIPNVGTVPNIEPRTLGTFIDGSGKRKTILGDVESFNVLGTALGFDTGVFISGLPNFIASDGGNFSCVYCKSILYRKGCLFYILRSKAGEEIKNGFFWSEEGKQQLISNGALSSDIVEIPIEWFANTKQDGKGIISLKFSVSKPDKVDDTGSVSFSTSIDKTLVLFDLSVNKPSTETKEKIIKSFSSGENELVDVEITDFNDEITLFEETCTPLVDTSMSDPRDMAISLSITFEPTFGSRVKRGIMGDDDSYQRSVRGVSFPNKNIEGLNLWSDKIDFGLFTSSDVGYWKQPNGVGNISKHLHSPIPNGSTLLLATKSQWFQNWTRFYSSLIYYPYFSSYDEMDANKSNVLKQNSSSSYTEAISSVLNIRDTILKYRRFPSSLSVSAPGGAFQSSWYSWVRAKVLNEEHIMYYSDNQRPSSPYTGIKLSIIIYKTTSSGNVLSGHSIFTVYQDGSVGSGMAYLRPGSKIAIKGINLSSYGWCLVSPDGAYTKSRDVYNGETLDTFTINHEGFFTLDIMDLSYHTRTTINIFCTNGYEE